MPASSHIQVSIDLPRIRRNVEALRASTGVPLIAVVKADAYGLGIDRVAPLIADLVDGFCVFSLAEAVAADLWKRTSRPILCLATEPDATADACIAAGVRPAVWAVERAAALKAAQPVLSVDTGMQRFSCPPGELDAVRDAGGCEEAFTHATRLGHVQRLLELVGNRGFRLHAAGSSLLHEPAARLDAVRPGLALYSRAVRVSTPLVDVRDTTGPAGYTGFTARRHGVILAGYAHGLRLGPCVVNGRPSRILEVGMQSAYVEAGSVDRVGDEVVLLGDQLSEMEIAAACECSPQEVLVRLCGAGMRTYADH